MWTLSPDVVPQNQYPSSLKCRCPLLGSVTQSWRRIVRQTRESALILRDIPNNMLHHTSASYGVLFRSGSSPYFRLSPPAKMQATLANSGYVIDYKGEKASNKSIDKQIAKDAKKEASTIRILVLGTGDSGLILRFTV
jgi:hypothetical protein